MSNTKSTIQMSYTKFYHRKLPISLPGNGQILPFVRKKYEQAETFWNGSWHTEVLPKKSFKDFSMGKLFFSADEYFVMEIPYENQDFGKYQLFAIISSKIVYSSLEKHLT